MPSDRETPVDFEKMAEPDFSDIELNVSILHEMMEDALLDALKWRPPTKRDPDGSLWP